MFPCGRARDWPRPRSFLPAPDRVVDVLLLNPLHHVVAGIWSTDQGVAQPSRDRITRRMRQHALRGLFGVSRDRGRIDDGTHDVALSGDLGLKIGRSRRCGLGGCGNNRSQQGEEHGRGEHL